jgi:hypothetical protein
MSSHADSPTNPPMTFDAALRTYRELLEAAGALPRTTERALWGQQGFLVGNNVFARIGLEKDGPLVMVKCARATQRDAVATSAGWVELPHEDWLRDVGWIAARPRSPEQVARAKEWIAASHALLSGERAAEPTGAGAGATAHS